MNRLMKLVTILIILFVSDVYSYNEMLKISSRRRNVADAIKNIKESFGKISASLEKSKIYNLIVGAITEFMNSAENPIADSIMCVINSYKNYNKYIADEKKSDEEKKKAEIAKAIEEAKKITKDVLVAEEKENLNLSVEISEEDANNVELKTTKFAAQEAEEEEEIIRQNEEEELQFDLENGASSNDSQENEDDIVNNDNNDNNIDIEDAPSNDEQITPKKSKKKKKGLKSWIKRKFSKAKKGFVKVFKQIKNQFNKVKTILTELFKKPLYSALLDFAICIIPQILKVAVDSTSLFAFAFSGGFVINIVKTSPTIFKNIIGAIRNFQKANDPKTQFAEKYQLYGKASASIILTLIKAFLGKPTIKCQKAAPSTTPARRRLSK